MLRIDHKHCTGCGSCVEACPQLAVVTRRDKYKFIYPAVDNELCTLCGRCVEVCPLDKPLSAPESAGFATKYYAAKAREKRELLHSHAGGIFGLLAKAVLAEGGVVYGVAFDAYRHPAHIRVDSDHAELLEQLRGYKPVQSDTSGIYTSVRDDAERGLTVLFCGTPCQCDGLRRFLGRDYPNLILADVLCGGVTSEGIFHRYVNWLEHRVRGTIREIRFENKPAFGHSRGLRLLYRRGRFRYLLSLPAEWDTLCAMSAQGYSNRRSCGVCRYASTQRVGDLSLGRFENIRRAHPGFPYDNGASLVIVSSPKGAGLFAQIAGAVICEESDRERALSNPALTAPTRENPHRAKLLTDIYRHGFGKAAEKFGSPGIWNAVTALLRAAIPDKLVILYDRQKERIKNNEKAKRN